MLLLGCRALRFVGEFLRSRLRFQLRRGRRGLGRDEVWVGMIEVLPAFLYLGFKESLLFFGGQELYGRAVNLV